MKKIGKIIVIAIVALCWVYFFYRFPYTGIIAKVLTLIILVPFTIKMVYPIILEKIQNKDAAQEDDLAKNFTPFSASAPSVDNDDSCFCPACGAKNSAKDKFCCNCGKPLN